MAGSIKRGLWASVAAACVDAEEMFVRKNRRPGRDDEEVLASCHTRDVNLSLSRGYSSTLSVTFHSRFRGGDKLYFYSLKRTHTDTYSVWPAHSRGSI